MSAASEAEDERFPIRLSVVTELENAGLAGRRRAVEALAALARQLESEHEEGRVAWSELLVGCDPEEWPREAPGEIVAEAGIGGAVDEVRYLRRAGADYFALKNAGAEAASGDVILFLDSDVIAEPGWLDAMLEAIADPGTDVVGSHCYIDGEDLVSRAYALFGTFPLREETDAGHTFLNSLAVAPRVMRRHPFPRLPLFRNSAHHWKREIEDAGVRIRALPHVRVAHPAPPGAAELLRRSLADGHDHYASRRHADGLSRPVSLALGLAGCGRRALRKTVRTLWRGPATGLGPLETAAAAGLCLLSHGARAVGCLASSVRDGSLPRSDDGWGSLRAAPR